MSSTTSPGMQASGDQFIQTYDQLVGYLRQLKTELDALRSQWEGKASQIFDQTMTTWGQSFHNILKHLDTMAELLKGGAEHVDAAEDYALSQGKFFT